MNDSVLAGLLTDRHELTMLAATLREGTAHRRIIFEVFAHRLPEGRRYGVVAGISRLFRSFATVPVRRQRLPVAVLLSRLRHVELSTYTRFSFRR